MTLDEIIAACSPADALDYAVSPAEYVAAGFLLGFALWAMGFFVSQVVSWFRRV